GARRESRRRAARGREGRGGVMSIPFAGPPTLQEGLLYMYVPFLVSTTFHEASHALVAKLLGDRTAYLGGQVSLNPLPHIRREPVGMVVLPLVVLVMTSYTATMGFAHIPVDAYWAERNPKRAAMVSLAGPTANFLLALLSFGALYWLIRTDVDIHAGNGMVF